MLFTSWDQETDYETSLQLIHNIGQEICPQSIRERHTDFPWCDIPALLDHRFDYSNLNVDDARLLRQYQAFYAKFEPLVIGVDKQRSAWDSFQESERQCRITNEAFRSWSRGGFRFHPCVESVFHRAQRKISQILGPVPSLEDLHCRFGPGATTRTKKVNASWTRKLGDPLVCSRTAVPYLSEMLHTLPHLLPFEEDEGVADVLVEPGKLQFVPKNAKTYRSIVVEPCLNSMFQLGVCDYMADRLRRAGIDITDQTLNQRLAREGSLTNALATLDLSSASDTVSTELVAHLLPVDWFLFLNRLRSSEVQYGEELIKLEKFSSMGNGFTFPLETLIFSSLAAACCEQGDISTSYGDDIIISTSAVPLLLEVLRASGFSVNTKKSYVEGPFRESCGKDYLLGFDIRPFYFKELLCARHIFALHNFLIERGFDCSFLVDLLHPCLHVWGPPGYGDGHLVGDWTGLRYRRERGWDGFVFETFSFLPRIDVSRLNGYRVLPVYSVYVRDDARETTGLPTRYGHAFCSLPGTRGVRRLSIYTFDRPTFIG